MKSELGIDAILAGGGKADKFKEIYINALIHRTDPDL